MTYKSALLESSSVSARRSEARPYGSCDGGGDNGRKYYLFIAVAVQETTDGDNHWLGQALLGVPHRQ